jgi:hypothetical protein
MSYSRPDEAVNLGVAHATCSISPPPAGWRISQRKVRFRLGKTLAKLASVGGGPVFRKAGVAALYEAEALDAWALGKIGPEQASTSDVQVA